MTREPAGAIEALEAYVQCGHEVTNVRSWTLAADADPLSGRVGRLALERAIQNFGEAAARIKTHYPELARVYPELQLPPAVAMRAVLAHDYDRIIPAVADQTADQDIPAATVAAEEVLRALLAERDRRDR